MGDFLEMTVIGVYRIFFEENQDSRNRSYFSATIQWPGQLPGTERIILDDRILPRLKKTIFAVLRYRDIVAASA